MPWSRGCISMVLTRANVVDLCFEGILGLPALYFGL